jgi:hypothetical protein
MFAASAIGHSILHLVLLVALLEPAPLLGHLLFALLAVALLGLPLFIAHLPVPILGSALIYLLLLIPLLRHSLFCALGLITLFVDPPILVFCGAALFLTFPVDAFDHRVFGVVRSVFRCLFNALVQILIRPEFLIQSK